MLSDYLGYACIACWLCAQFPQVIENIRLRSCEGLALPFLANWLLGDISNLVGCILTHQLPFQTWLATYFVLVDLTLVGQYVYYQYITPKPVKTRVSRRYSIDRATPRYRTLSAVAANVAAAAALAAQDGSETPRASARWPRRFDDEQDEEDYGPLADSFHSEGGRDIGRKRVSWSTERSATRGGSIGRYVPRSALQPPMRMASSTIEAGDSSLARGRSLRREIDVIPSSDPPPSATRQSRASRRGANMVFLGAFALFSIGVMAGSRRSLEPTTHLGRVLYSPSLSEFSAAATGTPLTFLDESLGDHPHHERPPSTPASSERVLGRIFAWLCTTLYLTSRLPQIWKNFVRKSVEGLSMYLFLFAFLGNSFYVASILTSPKFYEPPPASTEFIRESIPYILGSAGTLMFDVTILTQSLIYRPKPRHRHRHRVDASTVEEQAGLLSGQAPYHESAVHSRGRTSSTPRDIVE